MRTRGGFLLAKHRTAATLWGVAVIVMVMENVAIKPEATIWHDVFLELLVTKFVHFVTGQVTG
jgi:hypothetical protein